MNTSHLFVCDLYIMGWSDREADTITCKLLSLCVPSKDRFECMCKVCEFDRFLYFVVRSFGVKLARTHDKQPIVTRCTPHTPLKYSFYRRVITKLVKIIYNCQLVHKLTWSTRCAYFKNNFFIDRVSLAIF